MFKENKLVTRFNEHLKRNICHRCSIRIRITPTLQGVEQHPPTQRADAMLELRLIHQYTLAQRLIPSKVQSAQFWCIFGQPGLQHSFGTGNHRRGVPQGVVKVEGNQLNGHSLPLLRLARGWALS